MGVERKASANNHIQKYLYFNLQECNSHKCIPFCYSGSNHVMVLFKFVFPEFNYKTLNDPFLCYSLFLKTYF